MLTMPDGSIRETEQIDYEVEKEPWIIINLKDGNRIRFKVTITEVQKIIGMEDNGKPVYYIGHQQVSSVELNRNKVV